MLGNELEVYGKQLEVYGSIRGLLAPLPGLAELTLVPGNPPHATQRTPQAGQVGAEPPCLPGVTTAEPILPPLPPSPNPPDLLLSPRPGRFEQSRQGERRANDRLQDMEPLSPSRLPAIEPSSHLGTLVTKREEARGGRIAVH